MFRVAVSGKQHVPRKYIALIIGVFIILVMNSGHFGALKNIAYPLQVKSSLIVVKRVKYHSV